jgi:ankyrin repeat protein
VTLYLNWLDKEKLNRRIINQQDLDGMSCLHLAVLSRNINVVRKLIQYGASKTTKDFKHRNPL